MNQRASFAKWGTAVAAFALGQALQNGNGTLTFPATVWLTLALSGAFIGLAAYSRAMPRPFQTIGYRILTAGLIWRMVQLVTTLPGIYLRPMTYEGFQRLGSPLPAPVTDRSWWACRAVSSTKS